MEKWSVKKKSNLLIAIIAILVVSAIVGTVIYLKNNNDSLASIDESNGTVSESQSSESETRSNEKREDANAVESEDKEENTTDNSQTDNEQTNNPQTENSTTYYSNNEGTTTTTSTGTSTGENGQNQGTTQTATQTNTYITEEPWYTKSIGWVPKTLKLDVNDIDIYKPNLQSRKVAIVNEDENVSTVFKGDIITYKIYVKNNGKVKAEGVHIYDSIPQGTEFVEGSIDNNGTKSENGEITWKKDINAGEEIVVSYKVKVILGDNIIQIDNTAKVNEDNTNTTHNPTITYSKEVKVISVNGEELENQIVTPGTRLRYYINLKNDSRYDATTRITDTIPEGTTLLNNIISGGGELAGNNKNKIVWKKVTVPAGGVKKVYFDVTVNKNRKETVTNVAKIGAEKLPSEDEQIEEQYTNTVKTPVFKASKKSVMDYNSNTQTPKLRETSEVIYVVTVKNSAKTDDQYVSELTGTVKLEDKFWIDDSINKMTYKTGSLVITDENDREISTTQKDESFLENIVIEELAPGQTATLTYTYTINKMQNLNDGTTNVIWDEISNNLYWSEPQGEEPSRPNNSKDLSDYKNMEDENDPTKPTADPKEPEKPGLIDTVIVHVEEEYTSFVATKIWDDESDTSNRPESIKFILQKNGEDTTIEKILTSDNKVDNNNNKWQVTFDNLNKYDLNGNEYRYTVREDSVEHYIPRYSEDGRTVTNIVGEGIQATVITTNANNPTVPMDVVFVLDVSSSMLDDPDNRNLKGPGNTNKVDTAKAITMVESVNKAIDEVIKSNPENRIAVQLYNSKISSTDSDYYLIELGKYERNPNGEYIIFNWSTYHTYYSSTNRYDGILTTTVNDKTGKVLEAKSYAEESIIGTYTQAGIQRGEAILTGATEKQVSGKDYTRVPVLILVTDGDPTHYNSTSVGSTEIIPSDDPGRTTYPTIGNRIAKEKFTSAEYYYYTMKQMEATKEAITTAYSENSSIDRTCKVYTIGIGLNGSMAEVLLNPSEEYIQNNLEDSNNINSSINNSGANNGDNRGYNNSHKTGDAFYTEQQTRLKNMLEGEGNYEGLDSNYTDKSFNVHTSEDETILEQLENAFIEVIKDSQEDIDNKVVGEERRLDLTDIDETRKFEIIITGTDFDDNEISINKSFDTFTLALSDTELEEYIKEGYYIDLSKLKSGSVKVTYVKNNSVD